MVSRKASPSTLMPNSARVASFWDSMIAALTKPLTKEESEGGRYTPPGQSRILFEGTLDEAQVFYQQTKPEKPTATGLRPPRATYTDGLPIIIPTEEKVAEMLKGTSHKPGEVIRLQYDRARTEQRQARVVIPKKKGTVVEFEPMGWTATVEKVAINAVMAGCKPEYLPVVLALAESGAYGGDWVCVSGPMAKELGMNRRQGMLDHSNPANSTIGRAHQFLKINLGGSMVGVNTGITHGSPFNRGGMAFAEDERQLPPGWKGLNEESGFKATALRRACSASA